MSLGKMAVFGVPSAAGARSDGVSRAPFALREAGLLPALEASGPRVVNLSDLSLFPYREDPESPTARNVAVASCAAQTAADEMPRALKEGFTLVLGGDCSLFLGVVGGARSALGRPVGVVYLDANADLNTPDTSPSGFLNGMALALCLGEGPRTLVDAAGPSPLILPGEAALVGFRAKDPGEEARIASLALALPAGEVRQDPAQAARRAILALPPGHPVVVHMDVDVLDPEEMPAKDCLTPGTGLTFPEAEALLSELMSSPRVAALLVAEYHPGKDAGGRQAKRLVGLLSRALARKFA